MGTGIGVTRPPATDCREPPEVGEARKDPSQETSEGEGPADTPISHCQPAELGGGRVSVFLDAWPPQGTGAASHLQALCQGSFAVHAHPGLSGPRPPYT